MVVVVDLAGQPRFFVGAVVGFAIDGVILTEREVAVSFSKLFL